MYFALKFCFETFPIDLVMNYGRKKYSAVINTRLGLGLRLVGNR